ncbi:MAG: long-chain-fatty-acid--CoA ligase [Phenylobacterium sp.]|jgi:fatty-acyl-CoA synthase|uniref:long-chain-fatty-acid--CoA ligase n=1 Tax=Phenylobacterium sp. TaxID=1871053 RepID=UPI002A36DEA2|nr:long-chain-fatty-acid--CoA ligase [Phenylobacterium sp.]MDX9999599.1 long-chain-fatty-acid--CoA ligase [Phenylobacterium sp.]
MSASIDIVDAVREQARRRPDAPAIRFEGRETSFADFDRLSSQAAQALRAAGVKAGERVGVLAKGTDDFFVLWFGALKIGACLCPVNWRLAPPEIAFVLKDAGCRALVCGAEYAQVVEGLAAECGLTTIVQFEPVHPSWPDFRGWIAGQSAQDPGHAARADDDVIQLYTSGTTGLPKGVQLTEGNYAALRRSAEAGWGNFDEGAPVLVAMPLFHVAGANMGLLSLVQGAIAVVLREAAPPAILEALAAQRIRHAFLVPALINMILQMPEVETADVSSLQGIYYGASPISDEVLLRAQKRFVGARFVQLYGLTETIGCGTWLPPEAHDPARGKLRACGVPSPEIELRIRTPDGREAGVGEVGEIEIRSACVMKGYWNRPDATAEAIDAEGWFRTGDAGYHDADGFVFLHDRVKDMIVSGGENVYPAEVENALFSHPAVADAAVIGVPDEKWGEAVKAVVVLRSGMEADAAELIAHCRERIAGYKAPKSVDFVDVLPRNPSGKVLRRELRAPYWAGRERQVG